MLHAKKMRLVPHHEGDDLPNLTHAEPDCYNVRDKYLCNVDTKTVQTPGTSLTRLDREMYDILHSNALEDRDKWPVYCQISQKYLRKPPVKSEKKKRSKKSQ